jgi:hypothetical protein
MKYNHRNTLLSAAVAALGLLSSGIAHADPVGTKTSYMLGQFPSSGSNAGKYAKASVDVATINCSNPSINVPQCFRARGTLNGTILNSPVEVMSGEAYGRHITGNDRWACGYTVWIFGDVLVHNTATIQSADVQFNVPTTLPFTSNDAPFTVKGTYSMGIDLSALNSYLGLLPNPELTVNYSLNGGIDTAVTLFPASSYGALVSAEVKPKGSMTANGSVHGNGDYYTLGPVRGKVSTDGNVQVIAPNSWVDLNASYSYVNQTVTFTESHYLRLLKGSASYAVDGWLNPAGQLVDVVTEVGCLGGLICDGTSAAWINVASGTLWNQTSSYMKYFTDGATNTIYSGSLPVTL